MMRRTLALILLALALALTPRLALAEGAVHVEYDSGPGDIGFEPSPEAEADEFFCAYRDLMPGDDRTQLLDVAVRNNSGRVRVYFRLETRPEDRELLAPLTFALRSGGTELGRGSLTEAFHDWTHIATFDAPGEQRFELFLSVPTSVGNEAAGLERDLVAHLRFEDDSPEAGQTGGNAGGSRDANGNAGDGSGANANEGGGGGSTGGATGTNTNATEWSSDDSGGGASSGSGTGTTSGSGPGDGIPAAVADLLGRLPQTGTDLPWWVGPVGALGLVLVLVGARLRRGCDE